MGAAVLLFACFVLLSGCAVNGRPMRFPPSDNKSSPPPSLSWYIEGKTRTGQTFSCSFVEFDERGDFVDFRQHRDCEARITNMVAAGPVLLVMYCHGWKNNSQSEDVVKFNSFLAKIASSPEASNHFRVHGVYLSWRGNVVKPYIDKSDPFYQDCLTNFGGQPIVNKKFDRWSDLLGLLPENADFFTRQRAAEHLVSALPLARAVFTYASAAKEYGRKLTNPVIVMAHSMGALMLERSLGQAMTGSIVMEWWDEDSLKKEAVQQKPALPFDFVLFLNSAAPSIYAKEMRDFLEADRNAQNRVAGYRAPVIVSLTSTADSATGCIFPLANFLAPLRPSLQRQYTNGIFGTNNQWHAPVAQWKFYQRTPGHQPYLVNHWIVPEEKPVPEANAGTDAIFARNISRESLHDPYVFFTSAHGHYPAAAWRVTARTDKPVTQDGLPLAMQDSNYWIMNCGKELIASHEDIWSTTTMEMYAGLYRLATYLKNAPQHAESALTPAH